jgi:predicted MFS family arabinose efflux permease
VKRSFSNAQRVFLASGLGLIAATYGLVRLAYGLFLPDVQHELGLRADVAGGISAGASAMYCVGAVTGLLLATRLPRALVSAATLIAGTGALGMAAAPDPFWFGAASVAGSAGAGLASPALVQLVGQLVPGTEQDRAQSIVNAGTGPGLVGAGVLALALLPDWRTAWAWSGVFTLVVGGVLLVASRRSQARDRTRPAQSLHRPGTSSQWLRAHARPVVVALLFGAGSAAVWTYGRSVLVDAGASVAVSVSAWIALGVGGAAVVVTARWTSRLGARTLWAVTAGPVALAVLALGILPGSTVLALVSCAVFGWGYTAATGALIAWSTEIDPERAAAGTSMLFVALVLGQAAGAAGAGAVVGAWGYPAVFVAGAVVTAVSALAVLRHGAAIVHRSSLEPVHDWRRRPAGRLDRTPPSDH